MARDLSALIDHTYTIQAIEPIADRATDQNGTALNLTTLSGSGICIFAVVGTSVFTPTDSNKLSLEVEESVDGGSNYTDVANANLTRTALTTLGAASTNVGTFAIIDDPARDLHVYTTTYLRTSKSVNRIRVVANFAGTVTGGIPLAVFYTQAHPGDAPTTA